MLGHPIETDMEKVKWEKADDALKVEGTLLRPGTFTGMRGDVTAFSSDIIEEIYESVEENIPLKVSHESDKNIGYATKFGIDENHQLWFSGYVFDAEAKKQIMLEGFDKVSGEFEVVKDDDNNVTSGILKAIAFCRVPAVDTAEAKKITEVAMSMNESEDVSMGLKEDLKKAGVPDAALDDVIRLFKEYIKKYPYPQPTKKEMSQFEARIQELEEQLNEFQKKELDGLVDALKKKGLKDPEKLFDEDMSMDKKIDILKRLNANLELEGSVKNFEEVKAQEKPNKVIEEASAELGLSPEEIETIMKEV